MQPMFAQGPSLQFRLLIALVASVVLMAADTRLDSFGQVRSYMLSIVSPIQYIANMPRLLMDQVSDQVTTHEVLKLENQGLNSQLRLLRTELLTMNSLRKENTRLRALLDSPLREEGRKMVAEIMAVDSNPFSYQIVINRGSIDGVYEGQPILNELGIVGQVLHVATTNSRILLINDVTHAIPVQVERNGIRAIAEGTGEANQLQLRHVPRSTDIQVGDRLVSSGLGGRFPEGYPVAIVTKFDYQEGRPYAHLQARSAVSLDRIRYVLLFWPDMPEAEVADGKRVEATQPVSSDKVVTDGE